MPNVSENQESSGVWTPNRVGNDEKVTTLINTHHQRELSHFKVELYGSYEAFWLCATTPTQHSLLMTPQALARLFWPDTYHRRRNSCLINDDLHHRGWQTDRSRGVSHVALSAGRHPVQGMDCGSHRIHLRLVISPRKIRNPDLSREYSGTPHRGCMLRQLQCRGTRWRRCGVVESGVIDLLFVV